MHVDARRGAALLILQAERRTTDPLGGGVEIRTVHHDGGVLAAELQEAGLDPASREAVVDVHPDLFRAGEHDAGDLRMPPQRLTRFRAVARQIIEETVRQAGIAVDVVQRDRKSTRLNSSHVEISYAVFCLKKKKENYNHMRREI